MKKLLTAWAMVLFVPFALAESIQDGPVSPPVDPSVKLGDADGYFCTAFRVSADYVVSAGHCVADGKVDGRYTALLADGSQVQLKVVVASDGFATDIDDFAVLRILNAAPAAWTVASLDCGAVPLPGTPVVSVGYPKMWDLFRVPGVVIGVTDAINDLTRFPVIAANVAVLPGNSGGPLYNVDTGKVVGIANALIGGMSFYTPVGVVCDVLHLRGPSV